MDGGGAEMVNVAQFWIKSEQRESQKLNSN